VARSDLSGPGHRAALTSVYDDWLATLLPDRDGIALVAVGGLGRREPSPYGDLDLILVHDGSPGIDDVAQQVWYPVWDSGLALDHSVRTIEQTVEVAAGDLKAAVGLLDARHLAGDEQLSGGLLRAARSAWRRQAPVRIAELAELSSRRWTERGELAFLSEPDLKESHGGLRDVQVVRALAATQHVDAPWPLLRPAHRTLLDVRDAVQRSVGRALDRLLLQDQDGVAAATGYHDADDLLRALADAGRTVAYATTATLHSAEQVLAQRHRQRGSLPLRRPLADGVVAQDGEVVLARVADPSVDAAVVLRVAAAAATGDLPISSVTLQRLTVAPPLPTPWPESARNTLVTMLGGARLVEVWEQLDRSGLIDKLLPEWEEIRSLPQRSPVHRFTVDRHCVETAAAAALLTREVARPDLLLLAALLHDVGKGSGGDHSVVGAERAVGITERMGLSTDDAAEVVGLVRHHLLLPDTATRRDLDDPATVDLVVQAVGGEAGMVELLYALARADGAATGPAAWTTWKAGLVLDLVERVLANLDGAPHVPSWTPDPAVLAQASTDGTVVVIGDPVHVVAADRPGLLADVAGAVALHRLEVLAASLAVVGPLAALRLSVRPRFGSPPDERLLAGDLRRAAGGALDLSGRLADRDRAYARPGAAGPTVLWFDDEATDATVVEVRAADEPGLLYRVTSALAAQGISVRSAKVSTLGGDAVDAFYLHGEVAPADRQAVADAITAAAAPSR